MGDIALPHQQEDRNVGVLFEGLHRLSPLLQGHAALHKRRVWDLLHVQKGLDAAERLLEVTVDDDLGRPSAHIQLVQFAHIQFASIWQEEIAC